MDDDDDNDYDDKLKDARQQQKAPASSAKMVVEKEKQPEPRSNLLLLAEHSTMSDIHHLRRLSPAADSEIRLKFYSDIVNDDDWFKQYIVVGESVDTAMANAVFASLSASTGSYTNVGDVSVETVTATFLRLIRYYNNHAVASDGQPVQWFSDAECIDYAETYTLLHFLRNDYSLHVQQICKTAEGAETPPKWFMLVCSGAFQIDECPYALLADFYKRHEKTLALSVPLTFAVRLVHFALVHEAYGSLGMLLSTKAISDALPLSLGNIMARHLVTRVEFTQALQEKEPDQVQLYVADERADGFKKQLEGMSVASLWPALSFLSEWTQASAEAKKHLQLRKTIDAIESKTEQAAVAARILETDVSRRVEQCKLASSQLLRELRFATEARDRSRASLVFLIRGVELSCDLLMAGATKGDHVCAKMLPSAQDYLSNLKLALEMDEHWAKTEYTDDPPALPSGALERQVVIADGEKQNINNLQSYITLVRSRLRYASADLQAALLEQNKVTEQTHEQKLEDLRAQLQQTTAASYFGDD